LQSRANGRRNAAINAATARWLALVGEFDRREAWAECAPGGESTVLIRANRAAGLTIDDVTCVPCVHSVRMDLPWIVDGLAEADPLLRALDAPRSGPHEPASEPTGPHATAAQAA
jgi:hypothetical protein